MYFIILFFVLLWSIHYGVSLVEQELLTLPEHLSSSLVFSGVYVPLSLVFCVVFCRSLFVFLFFFFWPLCCLSFFDLRILTTLLVSSDSCLYRFPRKNDVYINTIHDRCYVCCFFLSLIFFQGAVLADIGLSLFLQDCYYNVQSNLY